MTSVEQLAERWLREAEQMEIEAARVDDDLLCLRMQEKAMGYRVRSCELEVAIREDKIAGIEANPIFEQTVGRN